jgi:outer membrane murein-binding lipoprotein Lpp
MAEGKKGFDLGSLLMVLVLLCILVAGLWMTGKALDSRFDELSSQIETVSNQIQEDIGELRAELLTARVGPAKAAKAAPAEEPAPPPAKKKKAK